MVVVFNELSRNAAPRKKSFVDILALLLVRTGLVSSPQHAVRIIMFVACCILALSTAWLWYNLGASQPAVPGVDFPIPADPY